MKELSIEEKAKRYDEAISIAREYDFSLTGVCAGDVIQDIFPELKESEDEKIRKAIIAIISNYVDNSNTFKPKMIAWLEKQGDNAYKVEPKFKIGDWIVFNGLILYIKEVVKGYYRTISKGGITNSYDWDIDNVARLWTIQDAKDGDVLYLQKDGKEHIIIYKGVTKERFETFVSAYCAYNGIVEAFCFADVSRYVDIAYEGIMPATKEQRDFLFQKMKEAGYEWNTEKKELKKIEQKQEWSSEDEKYFFNITYYLEHPTLLGESNKHIAIEMINWLKSLKERVQLKPQQEWSEEDKDYYDAIIAKLEVTQEDAALTDNQMEFLKSLRSQSHWKPCLSQLNALSIVAKGNVPDDIEEINSLYNDLKKLKR